MSTFPHNIYLHARQYLYLAEFVPEMVKKDSSCIFLVPIY